MEKPCLVCGAAFFKIKTTSKMAWVNRKTCSITCKGVLSQIHREAKNCKVCGKTFYRNCSKPRWEKAILCSRTCHSKLPRTIKWKENIGNANRGRRFSSEIREKLYRSLNSYYRSGNHRWNKGKKLPQVSGENHYRWIKNRSELVKNEKKHLDGRYVEWMRQVKNRDGWECKISNQDCSGRLEAHHILNWVEFPELRYQITNGITLCHAHHPRGRAKEKRLEVEFQQLVSVSKV